MGNQLKKAISGQQLAKNLNLKISCKGDVSFQEVVKLSHLSSNALTFSKSKCNLETGGVVIAPPDSKVAQGAIIYSDNPRLDFCRALLLLEIMPGFEELPNDPMIHPSAKVGKFVDIGKGVKIGANSVISNFVHIGDNVWIGEGCKLRTGAIVGEEGYGFERDDLGIPIRMPHLGGVRIGNDVLIGAATTICRGTLDHTVIGNHVKIDDHVHIAHNCRIENKAMIVACAEVSGGVNVKEGAWIGPNASVIQQLTIGSGALVGLGATVVRSVEKDDVVVGNPAKSLKKK